jgi:hypothetical protein
MLQLRVTNGFVKDLPGLGIRSRSLAHETVTPKVRKVLWQAFGGKDNVCSCCEGELKKCDNAHWHGKCCIRQDPQGTRCRKLHCSHKWKAMLTHFEYYIYPDIWRLIFADDPAVIKQLEAEIGHSQAAAVDEMIEQTGHMQADEAFWRDNLPAAYVSGRGTADARRQALRAAWRTSTWPIPR